MECLWKLEQKFNGKYPACVLINFCINTFHFCCFFFVLNQVNTGFYLALLNSGRVPEFGFFSGSYFPVFGTDFPLFVYSLWKSPYLWICGKMRTRENSGFGHFSRNVPYTKMFCILNGAHIWGKNFHRANLDFQVLAKNP